ncbi:MAG: ABC transporter permease [Crocinitomicaceae bacterium]|nr:ABC transporter permease [Crocinitomicaceae bacterium]|tara:strand:- start:6221 stop:7087 length:867 start_codon:yes stop_codon:yes gene_type:complete
MDSLVNNKEEKWTLIINQNNRFKITSFLRLLSNYKDLLFLFVKRDFVSQYKQTIFGPLWFIIQPVLTTITFTLIFGNLAKIPTDGIPNILFYMSGVTFWNYFADCVNKTSSTFVLNQGLFSKVYFPRIIVPFAVVINNLLKFGIQFLLLLIFWLIYYIRDGEIYYNYTLFLLPFLILIMALLGLGIGMIISSMTTKYRDLSFLVSFGVQLLMYASPIVYPLSIVPYQYKWLIFINPMTSVIETFKFGFLGNGEFDIIWLSYSLLISIIIFFAGLVIFNKVEKSFIDTV